MTASDAEYLEAARLLVDAYEREGHLDLATRKVEEVVASKGADSVPIESCDRSRAGSRRAATSTARSTCSS